MLHASNPTFHAWPPFSCTPTQPPPVQMALRAACALSTSSRGMLEENLLSTVVAQLTKALKVSPPPSLVRWREETKERDEGKGRKKGTKEIGRGITAVLHHWPAVQTDQSLQTLPVCTWHSCTWFKCILSPLLYTSLLHMAQVEEPAVPRHRIVESVADLCFSDAVKETVKSGVILSLVFAKFKVLLLLPHHLRHLFLLFF